jgi:glycerol-3-phosphate acyltransferase PlsY
VIVLAVDLGKGVLAVMVGVALAEPGIVSVASGSVICAVAAVVGHNWSLFASLLTGTLRGGKGAATAAGTWLLLVPAKILFLPVLVLLIAIIKTRYMSLGVLLSVATAAISLGFLILTNELEPSYVIYYLVGVVIVFRFRDNERRIGERVKI